ncbi:uncharacterized protein LOC108318536 [Cebus imitator]|uniref:uncharacterized protein LOC108318536 n=1 Tax=Cebus imitator TaxID=2715852 RepID=UPI000809DE51|nr:uncharacterized protein LOC108318536 [Cebus imitator]
MLPCKAFVCHLEDMDGILSCDLALPPVFIVELLYLTCASDEQPSITALRPRPRPLPSALQFISCLVPIATCGLGGPPDALSLGSPVTPELLPFWGAHICDTLVCRVHLLHLQFLSRSRISI